MSQAAQAGTAFDIREIPFSFRGSWLNISPVVALHTRRADLHLVTHQNGMHAVLKFVVESGGSALRMEFRTTPSVLEWRHAEGASVQAAFEGPQTIRLRGSGAHLRVADATGSLTPFSGTYLFADPIDGSAVFTSYESGRRYRISALRGELLIEGAEALGSHERAVVLTGSDGWECVIEEIESARAPYASEASFDQVVEAAAHDFSVFADAIAGWRDVNSPAAELAAYVLWSATVSAKGFLGRDAVLMSKHWMDKVWSWDHCFNAIALAVGEPDFALDQFLLPFDHQDDAGGLPDSVTHSEILYNFVKPPIHGWALTLLRRFVALDRERLMYVYDKLARSSRFWLDYRRVPSHPLPYYQHGNDSGWDNSTTFDRDRVIEAPDLAAFLVVQLDVLAGLADELDLDAAAQWRAERDALTAALVDELWQDGSFVARSAATGRLSKTSSLLNLLPIVAGERLPPHITQTLAANIRRHLTQHGPATEPVESPDYESDGYWRGPIWAPSTVLIEDGLRRSGFVELADLVSDRFRRLCEASGFAENFDARTGQGLRDRAYTWTASSYLHLAREATERRRAAPLD